MLACYLTVLIAGLQGQSGLVYGDKCAFFVSAPAGWTLDNQHGKVDGLPVVFYPHGSSWDKAAAAMYARTVSRDNQGLRAFIKQDAADFFNRDPHIVVKALPSLSTKDHRSATVREFDSKHGKSYDAVAYIPLPQSFALIVLTARDASSRGRNMRAFQSLVASFFYAPLKIETKHPRP